MQIIDRSKIEAWKEWGQNLYERVDEATGGTLSIIVYMFQKFSEDEAAEAAAAIAYYALFSLFPLLLFLTSIGSLVLQDPEFSGQVLNYVKEVLPTAEGLVESNINQAIEQRGTVNIIATVGLLWAATTVFAIMARNVNLPWHNAEERNFFQLRLVGLGVVGFFTLLIVLSIIISAIFRILPAVLERTGQLVGGLPLEDLFIWQLAATLVPYLFTLITFIALYRWVPNTDVRWKEVLWGAGLAALAWEGLKALFTWYLSSGLANYQLVYGSLGTVIALMLWIYLSALIILLGSYLSASIAYHRHKREGTLQEG